MALVVSKGPKKLEILKGILESTKFDDDLHGVSHIIFVYSLVNNGPTSQSFRGCQPESSSGRLGHRQKRPKVACC